MVGWRPKAKGLHPTTTTFTTLLFVFFLFFFKKKPPGEVFLWTCMHNIKKKTSFSLCVCLSLLINSYHIFFLKVFYIYIFFYKKNICSLLFFFFLKLLHEFRRTVHNFFFLNLKVERVLVPRECYGDTMINIVLVMMSWKMD